MRYAKNEAGSKIEVEYSGQIALCPECNSIVIGHFGHFKEKHWKHKSRNCDSWYEPMSEWHFGWQDLFPIEFREVVIKDINSVVHRADVRLGNGLVIEIQNSPIKLDEIVDREMFYGSKNMIWVLNGENLANKCQVKYALIKKNLSIEISLPDAVNGLREYNFDDFRDALFDDPFFMSFNADNTYECQNGNYFLYKFSTAIDFSKLRREMENIVRLNFANMYGVMNFKKFEKDGFVVKYSNIENDYFKNVTLVKKNWRKFIDAMTFPVFIDRLPGLDENFIYWYQKEKIIPKEDFLTILKGNNPKF
ncbi:hypothetical protein LQ567_16210 [Niabella pedocola]|uniref:Competence protein CoiA nuclease-like domain-containing protein n=1 Tax=Niabella pedocola TaxID=1752077 RepID=A0ABS8PU42_9BACT|nr:competence protein CoiA family protein [Niabella pedocola]MCD2424324.1 hypothetical protein [Niabella pedocola]